MAEVYRKYGKTVRWENGVVVRVDEAGEAIEDGQKFSCRPIAHDAGVPAIDSSALEGAVRALQSIVRSPLAIERLVVSEGVAEHRFGDRQWRETTRRIHLSMTFRSIRALVDCGDFDLTDVRQIAEALPRAGDEQPAPSRIALAPNVTAAFLPSLVNVAPPNVRIVQSAGGFDGKGQPVTEHEPPWPNWYRPSYRTRPLRAPFNLRATCEVTQIDDDLPRAVALLAPPDGLMMRVLCVDRSRVYPATLRVSRIDAVADSVRWYPYGAGSFGAAMML